MKVNKTTEDVDGNKVTFVGELSGTELDYVLQTGLNFLLYNGLLPIVKRNVDLSTTENNTLQ